MYTIQPSPDNRYIILTVVGDFTRALAMQTNLESHALGRDLGIRHYLVDLTEARNVDDVVANYQFAYTDMQEAPDIDRSARVAVLVAPGDHSHDFIETVAKNAGLTVTLFRDRDAALAYLLEG